MKKNKGKLIITLLILIIAFIYYYITLPAINIHSSGFWIFIFPLCVIILVVYIIKQRIRTIWAFKENKGVKTGIFLIVALLFIYLFGTMLSSPIVNANRYQQLMSPETRDFTEDIKQINYSQIPILDKDSAKLLGNRKMGNIADMVSQFEINDIYSQINFKGKPVRVTPLDYASPIKWLTNHFNGIPAYIKIDLATQDTELVRLEQPIKYSEADYFNRNIYRHIRFGYPTYIFDQLSFEIDEEGVPYWICPVKKYNIGLFGGQTIGRVVLCNAITGEMNDFAIEDCPVWVDSVYPADLLIQLYNYHGNLINGHFNSIFAQKGCLTTTDGYNYLVMEDDVWVYTGITSLNTDQSNVGFVLINQRTMESRYYKINGAQEYSAMASAEGQVQHLGYHAAFPILLNIANTPTYLIALKDDAGLVKKYAMLNIQKYQNVAIGDTVSECEKSYIQILGSSGIANNEDSAVKNASGRINKIVQSVIDGNSHFYISLENKAEIFDILIVDFVDIIKYNVGDWISLEYIESSPLCTVTNIIE